MQSIAILGATGSIGQSTLDVVARHPDRYRVFALTAQTQIARLAALIRQHCPSVVVVPDERARQTLLEESGGRVDCEVFIGVDGLCRVAAAREVTTVMAAIVGAAGLAPTLEAVRAGKRVLLANKEALVMTGQLFMELARQSQSNILPIDSEHNAVFQSLPPGFDYGLHECGVSKIVLTASGGPFRTWALEQIANATPDQAIAHPNWSMGRKISVDSATMMNKGLEVIEARWLFGVGGEQIDVVVHPQSVIHSMVQYVDGSVVAQLGNPDMRTPIAHALAYPERIASGVAPLNFASLSGLTFEMPDARRFPCLGLAFDALRAGGHAPAVLNAANEVAVAGFLDHKIRFGDISSVVAETLTRCKVGSEASLDAVLAADESARHVAHECMESRRMMR
ncbi:1-deoxy-D-xylulose-5-phosphate reductoisomerase [Niveibacterium sp. 24ML]|uniref:1-deoxy-D-xylulose-5-phosphate reductoisomerase n=1 Tax=Niveibacterium sp. 24ML TaxID=2985512 RepID=UPI00226FDEBC|nr:1-deoxy-D-xylulose-5-phosphate reductoisomerase [Niveibacterium sp. 24ML]MCX9156561.1 1-deoxy-D-xylulose-5-phosphate reductoisomerase [Niveibacterium sp. 24ML]